MKLYYSPTSPYVRKVSIVAAVTGLEDRIERIAAAPHPIDRDPGIIGANPLGKAPTLVTDDGLLLFDSRVIIEYLDAQSLAARVIPVDAPQRWRVLTQQALGDGILDAALLIRYESVLRPAEKRSDAWHHGQLAKIIASLDVLERDAAALTLQCEVGTIAFCAALGFLDFRMPDFDWRDQRPQLAGWFARFDDRPEVAATRPRVAAVAA